MSEELQGAIVTVNSLRGFGFIRPRGNGHDIYFHCTSLPPELPFGHDLLERDVVFSVIDTPRGPRAVGVRPLEG